MNKTELVAAMAEQTNLSKKDAEAALKAFIDVVSYICFLHGTRAR